MRSKILSLLRFEMYIFATLVVVVGIVATTVVVNNTARSVNDSLFSKAFASGDRVLPPASARLGLYPGASAETRVDRFEAFETWLGRPLAAAGGNHGWHIEIRDDGSKKFEMNANSQGLFLNPPGRGGSWQRRPDVVLGLTVPLLPSTRGGLTDKMRTLGFDVEAPNGTKVHIDGFQDIAGGALDDQYRKLAENIKAAGAVNRTYIRLGHEAEINFYPWSMRDKEVGDAYGNMNERYKEAFRHVVGVFRSVDPGFMFDYQGDGSWAEIDPQTGVTYAQSGYPGDEYVNVIGVDIYDTRSWEENKRRLDETKRLAILHGKQLSVPEWGLVYKGCKKGEQDDGDPNRGGGDNPAFIQNMYEWLNALPASGPGSLAYHIYFSGPDVSCHNINRKEPNGSLAFPRANAKFKELFGPGNVVGITPTPRPPTVAPTMRPTLVPTAFPTGIPSATPIPSPYPTNLPTPTSRPIPTPTVTPQPDGFGLIGRYYKGKNTLSDPVITRLDPNIQFNWRKEGPFEDETVDTYRIRWVGKLIAPKTEKYQIYAYSDDGVQVYIGQNRIINDWSDHAARSSVGEIELITNKKYSFRVEYYEGTGRSQITLYWKSPTTPLQPIPSYVFRPNE